MLGGLAGISGLGRLESVLGRNAGASALGSALVFHSALEGAASANDTDSIGGATLTQSGGVGSAAGKIGNARAFNGTNQFLTAPSSTLLQAGDVPLTIGGFLYLGATGVDMQCACKGNPYVNATCEYGVVYVGASNRFAMRAGDGTTRLIQLDGTVLVTGQYYFVLGTYDPTGNVLTIQVNNGTIQSLGFGGTFAMQVGTGLFGIGGVAAGSNLNGRADEVFVAKGWLPDTAARNFLYNGGAGRTLAEMRGYRG